MNIIRIFKKIRKEWVDGLRLSPILKSILVVMATLVILTTASWLLTKMVRYIIVNIDWVIAVILITISACVTLKTKIFDHWFSNKMTTDEVNDMDKSAEILEQNYDLLRKALFVVCNSLYQVINIKKPFEESELESTHHSIRKGNVILYEFALLKTGSSTISLVKTALEREIALHLKRQSFIGISQQYHIFQGQTMSIIQVDSVEDCGAYYKVYLAIADDAYCMYRREALSMNLLHATNSIKAVDVDF